MRILVDLHRMPWHEAWAITVATLSYTNHTLLPEALESWPVPLFSRLLPRHLQIIYLINEQHLKSCQQQRPNDPGFMASVSLIDEHNGRRVRMGHLAFLGSHRVNGVSALHTDLMRETVFRDLHALHPDRIVNKTNGIDFRRWLHQSNPRLTQLLQAACGNDIVDDPKGLERLLPQLGDSTLQEKFMSAKRANKLALSRVIRDQFNLRVDPAALFDVQVKRIHEYKRQLLNLLETIALYNAIRVQPHRPWVPRVKIFAGKAAASYTQAKLIIRLAHDVAQVINRDPLARNLLKVVFLPNYNVSLAEAIMPAADLSEQISTAGMEASGTGNMKLALNGAITIGTLDGANVEIRNHVGDDNIFIFGLRADEVAQHWTQGWDPNSAIAASSELPQVLDAIEQGVFSPDDPYRYSPLVNSLRYGDHYMIAADFDSYYEAQRRVDDLWRSPKAWAKMAMINTAKMAWFSSDRSIAEYAAEIWKVPFDAAKRP